MARPYPLELRQRVMDAYDNGESTIQELCERFMVSRNLIRNWEKLRKETGSLMPRPRGGTRDHSAERSVDAAGDQFIRELLAQLPDSSIPEVVSAYKEEFGTDVHPEAMRRTFHRLGFRFKKGRSVPSQRKGPTWSPNEKLSVPR